MGSGSPQRRAILEQIGISFTVHVSDVEEESTGDPVQVAEENARRKALAVAAQVATDATVLGADTDVGLEGDVLGKPADADQARAFMARLAGRTHQVVGGIAVVRDGELVHTSVEVTQVHFRPASPSLIDWYVGTGEWRGRAGGYAIQGAGAALIAGIEGDYLNVVGLPLARLLDAVPELLPV
ncbi:Maf family protein [Solirubrobacter phytolaccae]|uniref:Nucleoside triphosphate pyrophosphatase n=1 Tax=Solirubrobacter phytolaccae TaxID=1404360 RepID=A0A9X3NA33_9ACTN|nr:nucleoside triphosphate pyrophosphatase [Solirubrobacter phytolaccae]MDA0181224.1 Maf family protein [Solirubrobacter phytolaccae]